MKDQHPKTALILGSTGRFGRHMTEKLYQDGWNVICQSRSGGIPKLQEQGQNSGNSETPDTPSAKIEVLKADIYDSALEEAARRADIIVHAINPPYPQWQSQMPGVIRQVISLAKAGECSLIVPGNVYNFGKTMPEVLTASTKQAAETKKGQLRIEMEEQLRAASNEGVQVIILRIGDFLEAQSSGNWFDTHMTAKLHKGRFMYPGKTDIAHAWGYLPDAARAAVELANTRKTLPMFNDIPFAGITMTGEQMRQQIEKTLARPIRLETFPWTAVKLMSLFNRNMREVLEMRYLWDTPHQLDACELTKLLPDFQPTPVEQMFDDLLSVRK